MQNEVSKQQKQATADLVKAKVAELNTAVAAAQALGLEALARNNSRSAFLGKPEPDWLKVTIYEENTY